MIGVDELHAPGERQHRRRDAEADHVGERIHFAAEIADGVGHARDAAVQAIQEDGDADGILAAVSKCSDAPRRVVPPASIAPSKELQDRDVAEENVARGEQRRQGVGRAPRAAVRRRGIDQPISERSSASAAPWRSPRDHDSTGRHALSGAHRDLPFGSEQHIHARAELDQADALARRHAIAGLLVTTMRRAISPAICLKTTVVPSPSTVTCSARCRRAGFLAGHQELALLVLHLRDVARDRRAVHVNVENIQEDADAGGPSSAGFTTTTLPSAGETATGSGRAFAVRIAKEVQTKRGQNVERQRPRPAEEIGDRQTCCDKSRELVIESVGTIGCFYFLTDGRAAPGSQMPISGLTSGQAFAISDQASRAAPCGAMRSIRMLSLARARLRRPRPDRPASELPARP